MSEFLDPYVPIERHGSKLPHWQQGETMQFVTFRLGDAMPKARLAEWREDRDAWMRDHPAPRSPDEETACHRLFARKLEQWLDEGAGSCLLRDPATRKHVDETLMRDHEARVRHEAWVVMPNHVHVLFLAKERIETLLRSWKGVSARKIGRGPIWQKGYRDTMIRDETHFANAVRYIRRNPERLRPDEFTLWESDRARRIE